MVNCGCGKGIKKLIWREESLLAACELKCTSYPVFLSHFLCHTIKHPSGDQELWEVLFNHFLPSIMGTTLAGCGA